MVALVWYGGGAVAGAMYAGCGGGYAGAVHVRRTYEPRTSSYVATVCASLYRLLRLTTVRDRRGATKIYVHVLP